MLKKEYTGHVKFCKYCKLKNHGISECRKLKEKIKAERDLLGSSGSLESSASSARKCNKM
jgi:hypothetical protein